MGDIGARLLAKALQINNKLKTIILDRNNITFQGMFYWLTLIINLYQSCVYF